MKRFGSWLLILAFIADSMVHPLLFSVEYIVVQHSLSDLETQLAYEKSEQIGKSQTIIVLQETDARKRGDIYSQNIFSEEHNGSTVCYTIVDSTNLVDYQKVLKKNETDPFSTENHSVFFKLQKDVFFYTIEIPSVIDNTSFETIHSLLYLDIKTNPFFAVQTPPPNGIV